MRRANLLLIGSIITVVSVAAATGFGVSYAVNASRLSAIPPEAAVSFDWSQLINIVGAVIASLGGAGGIATAIVGYIKSGQAATIVNGLIDRISAGDAQGATTFAGIVSACIAMKAYFKGSSREQEVNDMLSKLLQYSSEVEFNKAK